MTPTYHPQQGDRVLISGPHPAAGKRGVVDGRPRHSVDTWWVRLRDRSSVVVRDRYLTPDPYVDAEDATC